MSDIKTSVAYYVNRPGFALPSRAVKACEQEAYAFLALGDLGLELIEDRKDARFVRPDVRPPYCPHLAVETADMAQFAANLRGAGIAPVHVPLEIKCEVTRVYLCDPDNNILEYIQGYRRRR